MKNKQNNNNKNPRLSHNSDSPLGCKQAHTYCKIQRNPDSTPYYI